MDRKAKSAIKSLVLNLRHKLEDEIEIQLKRYGFAAERWRELEELPHIERDDEAANDYFRLRAALEQELRRMGVNPDKAKAKQRSEAVDWFVREVAFTHLNRLVALKALEIRQLIPEIITTRPAYGGRSRAHYDYRNSHPEAAQRPDDALPDAIRHSARAVHAEFKLLFDVGDPAVDREPPANAILWPSYPVLKECIRLINGLDEAAENEGETLWAEDEIIGWNYQFYNTQQKEAIRKRGRPRRPMEVAVINQFFTPRWIVKFLVDNTLGRLWLEMRPDSKRVRAKCDYLVPEPIGDPDDSENADGNGEIRLDPDSPINNANAAARRDPKRPQEIRLIDPACGTMHFGHYAFEVFQEIYRDAREQGWVTGSDALPDAEIPAAILRHNLYGVDIDLRAVQLAGLSLFIKAKTANPDAHIGTVNLVVADAVLPADGARAEFLAQYADNKKVQKAVEQVLEEMENVAEMGSLLRRVEERLRDSLAEAGQLAALDLEPRAQRELPGLEHPQRQMSLAEAAGSKPEGWGAYYTVARLLRDLQRFAAEALQTHDLNAQLFAEEAEKSVHLLDVFLTDYDVVVMNPPYGELVPQATETISQHYPSSKANVYACFVERAFDLLSSGYVGAITERLFLTQESFESFRREVVLQDNTLLALLDLWYGVLDDAMNRTAAHILRKGSNSIHRAVFFDLKDTAEKEQDFSASLNQLNTNSNNGSGVFIVDISRFARMPRGAILYKLSPLVTERFDELPSFGESVGRATQGLITGNNKRFTRFIWEIHKSDLRKKWFVYAKGGDSDSYYKEHSFVVRYDKEAKRFYDRRGRHQGVDSYFKSGISWGDVSGTFDAQFLSSDIINSQVSYALPISEEKLLWRTLASLNSALFLYLLSNIYDGHHWGTKNVQILPWQQPGSRTGTQLSRAAKKMHSIKQAWDTGNEICTRFDVPWLVQAHCEKLLAKLENVPRSSRTESKKLKGLPVLLDFVCAMERAADVQLHGLQAQIDEAVYDLYDISQQDRELIERELDDRPPEVVWPQMAGKSDKEKRREHVHRLLSWCLLEALKEKRDGILSLRPIAGQETALDAVRRRLEREFGEEAAYQMESDIKKVLGRDIGDWLDGPFIKWHTKLYNRRPVIWQLSSDDYHNTFNVFLYIHRMDGDTLRKVQTLYLWPQRRALQSELETAQRDQEDGVSGATARIDDAESALQVLADFEETLLKVIQGEVEDKSPDWAEGPFRNGVYDPVLDDGVKVNIDPLQRAGLLRYKRLV